MLTFRYESDYKIYSLFTISFILGGCPEIAIFSKIKACSKNYRRHIVDIGVSQACLGGCPGIAIFFKIKACSKNYRRHIVDISRIIF